MNRPTHLAIAWILRGLLGLVLAAVPAAVGQLTWSGPAPGVIPFNPNPVRITSVTDSRARIGAKVVIRGEGFHLLAQSTPVWSKELLVKFGGAAIDQRTSANWQYRSPNELWAWVPGSAQNTAITLVEKRTPVQGPLSGVTYVTVASSPAAFECLGPFPVVVFHGGLVGPEGTIFSFWKDGVQVTAPTRILPHQSSPVIHLEPGVYTVWFSRQELVFVAWIWFENSRQSTVTNPLPGGINLVDLNAVPFPIPWP